MSPYRSRWQEVKISSLPALPAHGAWLSLVERCVRDAEAAGSNPVAPTYLQIRPFGENVKRLSLLSDQTYVAQGAVQTYAVQNTQSSLPEWPTLLIDIQISTGGPADS